jgi:hypothetical protein
LWLAKTTADREIKNVPVEFQSIDNAPLPKHEGRNYPFTQQGFNLPGDSFARSHISAVAHHRISSTLGLHSPAMCER